MSEEAFYIACIAISLATWLAVSFLTRTPPSKKGTRSLLYFVWAISGVLAFIATGSAITILILGAHEHSLVHNIVSNVGALAAIALFLRGMKLASQETLSWGGLLGAIYINLLRIEYDLSLSHPYVAPEGDARWTLLHEYEQFYVFFPLIVTTMAAFVLFLFATRQIKARHLLSATKDTATNTHEN